MPWFTPVLIFFARICDQSIGTLRVIMVIRGHKLLAAAFGFVEAIVWVLAVSQVLVYIRDSWLTLIAYGGGFAAGNLIGMLIEQRIALGEQMVRIINTDPTVDVAPLLRSQGFLATEVRGEGATGEVEVSFTVAPRRHTQRIIDSVLEICPRAFITVEDVRHTSNLISRREASRTPLWLRMVKFK